MLACAAAPDVISRRAGQAAGKSRTMSIETTPAVVSTASAYDFQRDLSRYWRTVRKQGGVPLTAQGWIYKSNFKTFLAALNVPGGMLSNEEQSNGRLWFMRRLLVHMRELQGDNFADRLEVTRTSKLLGLPMAQRVRWSFEAWRDGGVWNELTRLPGQHVSYDHRRDAPPGLAKSRNTVLKHLAKLSKGAGTWQGTAALVAQIKRTDYTFLFERRRGTGVQGMYASPYYSSNNPYGMSFTVARDEASGWDVVERAFVIELLTGPLFWLGLVDLGYNVGDPTGEQNPPLAYRLTDTGAWLCGVAEQPVYVETGGRIVVQPNFNILAMEPVNDALLIDLDQFADSLGGDRAVTYEITRESLYRGQLAGWSAKRVIAFLEKHQGAQLPANVTRTLQEWETAHQRITFHRKKLVVQFADEDAEAQASLALSPLKPNVLGERFLIVPGGDIDKANVALRDAGWMPTVQAAGHQALEKTLRVEDDGAVTFVQSAPSVYALGRLMQFAEGASNGASGFRISAASVRAAMNRDLDVEQLLAMLAEMHSGPISTEVEQSIRQWAGYYGSGSLKQVVLLELSNADVLANLVADEGVGAYVTPIDGSARPLAMVDAAHVDAVRAVLMERGIEMSG